MPCPEQRQIFWGTVLDVDLPQLIESLDVLAKQRVVDRSCVNVGYANRFAEAQRSVPESSALDCRQDSWNFYVIIEGQSENNPDTY